MQLMKLLFLGTLLICALIFAGCGDDGVKCPSIQIMCQYLDTWICVTPDIDEDHCGGCNNKCGLHRECVDGECVCEEHYSECEGECVNLYIDAANCGTCGNACSATQTCVNGICG